MIESIKKRVYEIENEFGKEIEEVCNFIFNNFELGEEEYILLKYLVEKMKEYGFDIVYLYCNMEIVFRVELGDNDGFIIVFLVEYDVFFGYGENKELVYVCGYNWIVVFILGVCIVLSKLKENFKGKIVLIGILVEEIIGGKCDLVKVGVFDDVDVSY